MIRLTIKENITSFKDQEKNSVETTLAIGDKVLANKFFSDFPPTYDEIDSAINFTEEALVPIQYKFNNTEVLRTNDLMAREIAQLAFNTLKQGKQVILPRIELENVFTRFADIVKGLPASQDILPTNKQFAAYLLIIREITHHLNFEKVLIG